MLLPCRCFNIFFPGTLLSMSRSRSNTSFTSCSSVVDVGVTIFFNPVVDVDVNMLQSFSTLLSMSMSICYNLFQRCCRCRCQYARFMKRVFDVDVHCKHNIGPVLSPCRCPNLFSFQEHCCLCRGQYACSKQRVDALSIS